MIHLDHILKLFQTVIYFDLIYLTKLEGISYKTLSEAAKSNNIYLVGGSIPERDKDNKLYNTSLIFGPEGQLLGKHRKVINIIIKIHYNSNNNNL